MGRMLKAARVRVEFTQRQLAVMVGCSAGHLRHVETGWSRPSEQLLRRILSALGVSDAPPERAA